MAVTWPFPEVPFWSVWLTPSVNLSPPTAMRRGLSFSAVYGQSNDTVSSAGHISAIPTAVYFLGPWTLRSVLLGGTRLPNDPPAPAASVALDTALQKFFGAAVALPSTCQPTVVGTQATHRWQFVVAPSCHLAKLDRFSLDLVDVAPQLVRSGFEASVVWGTQSLLGTLRMLSEVACCSSPPRIWQ
jgi:hypothetical protein